MKIILTRYYSDEKITLGLLKIEDSFHKPIYTLENPWKDNAKNISCIPEGEYICVPYSSAKYADTWEVTKVPNRTYILFHSGNYVTDTQGCILPGLTVGPLMVGDSRKAMDLLREYICKNNFILEVKNGNYLG